MSQLTFPLVGKEIEIVLPAVEHSLLATFENDIILEAKRLEKVFNFYDPESELSTLNSHRNLNANPELLTVLIKALQYCKATVGAYDISMGKQFLARKHGQPLPLLKCSYKDIQIAGNQVTLQNPDVLIDLGSIAKGFIADKLVDYLKGLGFASGLVDARGDLHNFGQKDIIGIQHPRYKESIIMNFELDNSAVATSGDYKQFYGSFHNSHIVGSKDFASVTVVAPSLVEADAVATCVFVLGSKASVDFLARRKHLKVLAIDKNLKVCDYNNFGELVR